MKTSILSLSAAMILSAPFVMACGFDKGPSTEVLEPCKEIRLSERQAAVQRCETGFALQLFREVASRDTKANLMISPFSASLCLSMAAAGAAGETFSQMAATLGFDSFTAEEIGSYYQAMCQGLAEADNSSSLAIANALWTAVELPLNPAYAEFLRSSYEAEVGQLDFGDPSSVNAVNGWVNRHTRGMIPTLLDNPDPDLRLLLANALYFKGKWAKGEMSAIQADFTDFSGEIASVPFMASTRELGYYAGEGYAACSLPYGNGAYRMLVLLPDEGKDFGAFVAGLTPELWDRMLKGLSTQEVTFSMPVFKGEYRMDDLFQDVLESMGMVLPFTGSADFSGISAEPLSIDMILQKTAVDVNEKGTEAAAVTAIGMKNTAVPMPPKVFSAERPFVYAIVEHTFSTLLFIGVHGK